ncbi:MAG: DUF2283 domain-containing protein [Chloroflexi bacterium]|nr:DUF2283 domain-containing protein [Chloroflexota bacterium]MBI4198506.1 DUF2283 domain-containing protein [Chloroflexota bacterium]
MKITYDQQVDALYIQLTETRPSRGVDIEEGVTVDVDAEGHIVGLEILDASERLGKEQLHSVTLKDLAFEAMPLKA